MKRRTFVLASGLIATGIPLSSACAAAPVASEALAPAASSGLMRLGAKSFGDALGMTIGSSLLSDVPAAVARLGHFISRKLNEHAAVSYAHSVDRSARDFQAIAFATSDTDNRNVMGAYDNGEDIIELPLVCGVGIGMWAAWQMNQAKSRLGKAASAQWKAAWREQLRSSGKLVVTRWQQIEGKDRLDSKQVHRLEMFDHSTFQVAWIPSTETGIESNLRVKRGQVLAGEVAARWNRGEGYVRAFRYDEVWG